MPSKLTARVPFRSISTVVFAASLLGLVSVRPAYAAVGHWSTHGPAGAPSNAVAVAPSNPLVIYAGIQADSGDPESLFGRGLYKSVDGGLRWRLVSGDSFNSVTVVAVDRTSPDMLYVGTWN